MSNLYELRKPLSAMLEKAPRVHNPIRRMHALDEAERLEREAVRLENRIAEIKAKDAELKASRNRAQAAHDWIGVREIQNESNLLHADAEIGRLKPRITRARAMANRLRTAAAAA
jgi:hypothetical protein